MFARNLGFSLLCHLGAIGVVSWLWQAAPGPPVLDRAPQAAEVEPVFWGLEEEANSPVVVPLSDCISASAAAGPPSTCPSPCAPCPACPEAGESSPSLTVQFGFGLFGLTLVEAAKLCCTVVGRLFGQLQRLVLPAGGRAEAGAAVAEPFPLPAVAQEPSPGGEPPNFEKLALEQARASRPRRLQQQ